MEAPRLSDCWTHSTTLQGTSETGTMAPKRPAEGQSGAEKKRAKMREQRTIPVEGRTGGSAASGEHSRPF
jgi:hypothetical protein